MSDSVKNTQLDNVDELYNKVYEPSEEQKEVEEVKENSARERRQEEKEPEYEINWKGEVRKVPLSKLKNYAQQSYDYNEKMREYNINKELLQKEREDFNNKLKEYEAYKKIDEYTKTNPDWWNYVQENWNKLSNNNQNEVNNIPNELTQKVEEVYSKLKEREEREQLEMQIKQDEELEKEVTNYKEKYPYFDWKSKDDEGIDLEKRILQHAIDNNISKFSAAANDYLHDEFLKRSKFEGKEDYTNKIRVNNKLGIKEDEIKKKSKPYDPGKSYDDLAKEALEELGLEE